MKIVIRQSGPLLDVQIYKAPEELTLAAELVNLSPGDRGPRFHELLKKHLAPVMFALYNAPDVHVEREGRRRDKVIHLSK